MKQSNPIPQGMYVPANRFENLIFTAGMKHYIETGEECYSLRDALQDMYLCLKMDEALANPLKPITTETMPWAE